MVIPLGSCGGAPARRRPGGVGRPADGHGVVPRVQADPDAPVANPAGGGIRIDQRLQCRHRGGQQRLPLRLRQRAHRDQRFGGELVGEDGLLHVRRNIGEHVGDRGAQMVADVAAEETVGPFAVGPGGDAVPRDLHGVTVDADQAEPGQLVEQAARVHVLRHRACQRLEARRVALSRQVDRMAAPVLQRGIGAPASEHLRGWRRARRRRALRDVEQASHLAPRQPGRRTDAADDPRAGRFRLRPARCLHEGRLQLVLDGGEGQAPSHRQRGDRAEQRRQGVAERRAGDAGGTLRRADPGRRRRERGSPRTAGSAGRLAHVTSLRAPGGHLPNSMRAASSCVPSAESVPRTSSCTPTASVAMLPSSIRSAGSA